MTRKLSKAELKRRLEEREAERERAERDRAAANKQRRARNEYMNGLVEAALKERSSGKIANPPYPPPARIVRPARAEGPAPWPEDDVRWTPSVHNQFHPDYDWRAALRYMWITGGWTGRSIIERVLVDGFDRTIFGAHPAAFKNALTALNALAEWCRGVSLPPIFEVFSPANAERFVQDSIKAGRALRTLDNRRGVYAKLWDAWSEHGRIYTERMQQGPCEPIENPWRQSEVSPAVVAEEMRKHKLRQKRRPSRLRVVSPASLDALAGGRKRIAIRTNEHHARVRRTIKLLNAKGIVSNTRIAEELNRLGVLGQRDGPWDATSVRRHLERTSKWGR